MGTNPAPTLSLHTAMCGFNSNEGTFTLLTSHPQREVIWNQKKPTRPEADSPSETWNWNSEKIATFDENIRLNGLAFLSYSYLTESNLQTRQGSNTKGDLQISFQYLTVSENT